ncbi:MAG: copper-binding protein [Hyphomonadaceae bacterium]|nr:copper-binding protein [Hyphomonadaceae bacterium]
MLRAIIIPIALLAAACSPPASEPAAKSDMDGMNMNEPAAAAAGPVSGTGVVTQVDAAAGTITFNHEAMAAINWPAMTMQFTAEDPSILQGIAVGDRVNFELKSASETGIVTMVQKQ